MTYLIIGTLHLVRIRGIEDGDLRVDGFGELTGHTSCRPGLNTAQENKEASYGRSRSYRRDVRIESQSAPLLLRTDNASFREALRMRSSLTRKFSTYALPTPVETARSPSSITSLANNNMASSNPAKAITKTIGIHPHWKLKDPQRFLLDRCQP
ncbi:hypothetical protein Bca52824_028691 [Brassica carinata]|uniref:Uncharacterized protein n=1 Tax=Brassica carinata TaxID=52824 RepID=A0A8X7VCN3_BRACI|nr:hypothetical protein Bca52824_028691 [Brassica carinata]